MADHVSLKNTPSFCVVVPMYNEESGAERCVRSIAAHLAPYSQRHGLIVVNDGSSDRTGSILDSLTTAVPVLQVVTHARNQGYGAALRTGIQAAAQGNYEYALFMDSDLTNDPADIARFVAKMEQQAEVIKASRYSGGGSVEGVPAVRYWISRIGNIVARLLFRVPIHDCTNGFRASRVSLLSRLPLKENTFAIIMEELFYLKYLAASFAEVPVVLKNRSGVQRPTSFRYRPSIFYDYLKYPLKSLFGARPFRKEEGTL